MSSCCSSVGMVLLLVAVASCDRRVVGAQRKTVIYLPGPSRRLKRQLQARDFLNEGSRLLGAGEKRAAVLPTSTSTLSQRPYQVAAFQQAVEVEPQMAEVSTCRSACQLSHAQHPTNLHRPYCEAYNALGVAQHEATATLRGLLALTATCYDRWGTAPTPRRV